MARPVLTGFATHEPFLYLPGATPYCRLNAVAKANSDWYPTSAATACKAASDERSSRAAVVIRHHVTYRIGDCPINSAKRFANGARDSPIAGAKLAISGGRSLSCPVDWGSGSGFKQFGYGFAFAGA